MIWPKPAFGTSYNYGGWGDTFSEAQANMDKANLEFNIKRVARLDRYQPETLDIEDDGEYVTVRWTTAEGERVSADFKMIGWRDAPATVRASLVAAPKGGAAKSRRRPARAKTPRS